MPEVRNDEKALLEALDVLKDWLAYEREVDYFQQYTDDLSSAIKALEKVIAIRV